MGTTLNESVVAFLMGSLVDGRVGRPMVRRMVAPWVEGDRVPDRNAIGGATLLHGFDLVQEGSRVWHADDDQADFMLPEQEMIASCMEWISQHSENEG